jgi:hypothetical protein
MPFWARDDDNLGSDWVAADSKSSARFSNRKFNDLSQHGQEVAAWTIATRCCLGSYVPEAGKLKPSLRVSSVSSIRVRIRINSVVTVLRSVCVLTEGPSISETNMDHGIQKRRLLVATNEHNSIIQQKPAFDIRPCENVEDILFAVDLQYSHTTLNECRSVTGSLIYWKDPCAGTQNMKPPSHGR